MYAVGFGFHPVLTGIVALLLPASGLLTLAEGKVFLRQLLHLGDEDDRIDQACQVGC